MGTTARRIEAVRRFSRFYTKQIGLLDEGLLASPYSLTEARIIYELAHLGTSSASELAESLGLDQGYLSRLLRAFEKRGLLQKQRSTEDRRRVLLTLSAAGETAFAQLNTGSRRQVHALLSPLSVAEQKRAVEAMGTIESLLGGDDAQPSSFVIRPHRPGDIGWVIQRHGELYHELRGWDATFEALVARIAASFVEKFDPRWERCWIAETDGGRAGSIFLTRKSKTVGQLRMLLVEPWARRRGLGTRLVGECVSHARHVGYRKISLYTSRGLDSARRLYEAEGFEMKDECLEHAWGASHYAQWWELAL